MTSISSIAVPITPIQSAMMQGAAAKPADAQSVQSFVASSTSGDLVSALQAAATGKSTQAGATAFTRDRDTPSPYGLTVDVSV